MVLLKITPPELLKEVLTHSVLSAINRQALPVNKTLFWLYYRDNSRLADLLSFISQVPLSLINVHIESKECQRACTQRQARQYAISVEAPSVQLPRPVRLPLAAGKPVPQKFQPSDGRPESDCLQQAASDAQLGTSSGGCGRHEYVPSLASKTCHDKDGAESSCVQSCHRKESSQPEIENSLPPPIAQLVPEPHAALPGEYRITDFVTKQEELDLIHMLDAAPPLWQDSTFNGKHRYRSTALCL